MEIEKQEPVDGYAEGEEPMVFYYNRERRIQNAPENVRDYYENGLRRPKGFFGVLFWRKGNKLLFITMIFTFVFVGFVSFLGNKKNEGVLNGVSFALSSFSFDENVFVSVKLKKSEKKGGDDDGSPRQFFLTLNAVDSDGTSVFSEETTANFEKDDIFLRTTFHDYGIMKVECKISNGEGELNLASAVEKR